MNKYGLKTISLSITLTYHYQRIITWHVLQFILYAIENLISYKCLWHLIDINSNTHHQVCSHDNTTGDSLRNFSNFMHYFYKGVHIMKSERILILLCYYLPLHAYNIRHDMKNTVHVNGCLCSIW